jgi:hypothetical protein
VDELTVALAFAHNHKRLPLETYASVNLLTRTRAMNTIYAGATPPLMSRAPAGAEATPTQSR